MGYISNPFLFRNHVFHGEKSSFLVMLKLRICQTLECWSKVKVNITFENAKNGKLQKKTMLQTDGILIFKDLGAGLYVFNLSCAYKKCVQFNKN